MTSRSDKHLHNFTIEGGKKAERREKNNFQLFDDKLRKLYEHHQFIHPKHCFRREKLSLFASSTPNPPTLQRERDFIHKSFHFITRSCRKFSVFFIFLRCFALYRLVQCPLSVMHRTATTTKQSSLPLICNRRRFPKLISRTSIIYLRREGKDPILQ